MMAFDCYYSSVQLYDDIRASLQLNDQWKISYRNQHQSAYKGLWRINLNQGQVVKALLAAEKGRAQALRDLMTTKYQPAWRFFNAQRISELGSIDHSFHSY